ncbi:MAG TPA: TRAP transporter small permease [Sedimentisphaerales bacterium]|jgi:TRAP-type C4-dicarboxylate transport system permease small subunit|nr:TRAP transporter small permease [Sedimentisphaerales bacterium]HNU28884.1 TRAP transporter small permease [Sedimentisphaerales bacterium]
MIATLRRVNLFFDRLLYVGTAASAMAFFAVVMVAMAARSVGMRPIHSSVELSRLFFVWSCFLGAALAYRRRAHIGFTLLFDKVPASWQRRLAGINYLLVLAFAGIVLVQSIRVCRLLWPTVLPILGISQAWFYVPVPILCLCLLSYTAESLVEPWARSAPEGGG